MTRPRPHIGDGVLAVPEAGNEPIAPELRIHTLGTPRVWLGEVPLTFRRRKSLALLVYLALTGRAHEREVLASLFVDRATDAQARAQFRTTLTGLVEQIGAFVLVTRETIALDRAQPIWLDADELQAATLGPSEGAVAADSQRLERAVALYEGAFLSGFALHDAPLFEDWMQQQRARLDRLHVQALQRLLEQAREGDDDEAALHWTTHLLAAEPCHEEAHRQMMRLLARGGQRQAALEQYAVCCRVLREELGRTPQAETQALYEQLCAGPVAPPHNLPSLPDTFLGREREVATLRARLGDAASRLITLLGLGGSGKTRLAVQVATHYAQPVVLQDEHAFADGVYLVDLAGVGSRVAPGEDAASVLGQRLAFAIGRVLGMDFGNAADPLPALARWLERKRLLLVLDNVEHVLAGVGVLAQLLEQAPGLKVLVTSRERLRLAEEWVLEVGGLALPSGPAEVEQAPASQLFVHHAQQVGVSSPPTTAERAEIVRICELTQGLPLALILAAHWRRALSCAAIAQELGRGLDLLMTPERGLSERQRSMRAVLARTWARLVPEEQAALRQLAVCRGGFTREAAWAVAGAERVTLLALRDRALLGQTVDGRYTLHELVRQYAAEQGATQPTEAAEAEARHARYYGALVERECTVLWKIPEAQKTLGTEIDNLQAAWAWAEAQGECGLLAQMRAGLLAWYWANSLLLDWAAQLQPAVAQVRAALAHGGAPAPEGQLLLGHLLTDEASMLIMAGQVERAQELLVEAEALSGDVPAPQALRAAVAHWRGRIGYLRRNVPAAQHESEQALALARMAGARDLEAGSLWQLGRLAVARNDSAAARPYLEQALALFQALGNRLGEAFVTHELGTSAFEQGHMMAARRCFDEVLRFGRTFGVRSVVPFACTGLGLVYDQGLGRHKDAEPYFAEALAIWRAMGFRPNDESCLLAYQGRSALAQGDQRRARVLFTRALRTARAAGDLSTAVGRTWALHGLGLLAHYTGDEREAERLARQALRMAQESRQRRAARFALRLLGHALFGQGKLEQAKSAYQQVLEIDQTLGYRHLAVEARADLARMALAEGDLARATASTDAVLAYWAEHTLEGTEEPIGVYRTCYAVLRAAQDPRATDVLARGHTLLQERAAQFDDEDRRRLFLENVPAHLWLRNVWRTVRRDNTAATRAPSRIASPHGPPTPIRGRPRARRRPPP